MTRGDMGRLHGGEPHVKGAVGHALGEAFPNAMADALEKAGLMVAGWA